MKFDMQYIFDVTSNAFGVISIFMGIFAIWISWRFYKASTEQMDKVADKIESLVNDIIKITTTNAIHTYQWSFRKN